MKFEQKMLGLLRILLGWIFLWPFLDKMFGLNLTTAPDKSWLLGNSPTTGFLANSRGPFSSIFQSMAGSVLVDWLFMIGLLLIGIALIFGIGMRIAPYAGALLLFLMWLAALPPDHNPFLDDHIIYGLILLMFTKLRVGEWYGMAKKWRKTDLVKKYPILE